MRATPPRFRTRGLAIALGLGTSVLLSAAAFYLGAPDALKTTGWALSAVLPPSFVPDSKASGLLESEAPAPPGPKVTAAPPLPIGPAPGVARAESDEPAPSRVPRRAGSAATPRAVAPAEPEGGAGVPIDRCVAPSSPTVAVQGDEVLGPVVGVKVDADSRPPRCLFVVERHDKALWVVDSSRIETRPR
jgi:hypothetical protein